MDNNNNKNDFWWPLKKLFTQKWKCCHHLLPLMSFQTCVRFFLMLKAKEDILKNQTVVDPHWHP